MAAVRLSWRHFWSRRARWRVTLATLSSVTAILLAIYLLIPGDVQSQVNRAMLTIASTVASMNHLMLLAGAAALLVLVSLCLVFARPYRRASYFVTTPSALPSITVYVDAENQPPVSSIRPFMRLLTEHLNGRRADLLYFQDASVPIHGVQTDKYKMLYRFGFRPIDVPHNPTGEGEVKEAVDKEITMHAIERALLGPPDQEFIIVTGDQDFVGLVYRLTALGHRVRIWSSPVREAYRTLATYLSVHTLDIERTLADLPDLTEGEERLYRVIRASLQARTDAQSRRGGAAVQNGSFRAALGNDDGPDLSGIGYFGNSRIDYWLDHLTALGLLKPVNADQLPALGKGNPIVAARQLYAVTEALASAMKGLAAVSDARTVRMEDLAATIARTTDTPGRESIEPLRRLLREGQPSKRAANARYLARCARALGLVNFEDMPRNPDIVKVSADQPTN